MISKRAMLGAVSGCLNGTASVSYTHLGEMEPSEFMTEINMVITELVKNTEMKKGANALMTVSYTHLDVYKRQARTM